MGNCQNVPSDEKTTIEQPKQKAQLIIKSSTWQRESHGLFDYESKTITQKNFKTSIPGKIIRSGESILWRKDQAARINKKQNGSFPGNDTDLIRLVSKEDVFWAMPSSEPTKQRDPREPPEEGLWLVVKSYKQANPDSKGYKLSEGEFIKLGRVRFRIKELKNHATPVRKDATKDKKEEAVVGSITLDDGKQSLTNSMTNVSGKVSQITCKICLSDHVDSSVGPFISPCLCAGTMKHVHLKCLQKWLQSRLHVKYNGNATSYHWKSFECELCKHPYPPQIDVEKKKCDLVEIPKPESPYILLEILSKDSNQPRGAYLISMESKSTIRMGRGHDSDIRITDISVSRCHAMIRMEKGTFYIEDNNSKFGTLVYANKPIAIQNEFSNISVQVGRTVLNLSLQRYTKRVASCFTSSKIPTDADEISEGEIQDDGFEDGNDSPDEQPGDQNQDENQLNNSNELNDEMPDGDDDENIEQEEGAPVENIVQNNQ